MWGFLLEVLFILIKIFKITFVWDIVLELIIFLNDVGFGFDFEYIFLLFIYVMLFMFNIYNFDCRKKE